MPAPDPRPPRHRFPSPSVGRETVPAGPLPTGRRSAGWVPPPADPEVERPRRDLDARLDELRSRVGDRVPPAWRGARLALPGPAAVLALVLMSVLAAVVVGVLLLGRPGAAPQRVPARAVVPAATPPAHGTTGTAAPAPQSTAAPVLVVHVVGAVAAPGVVELPAGSRVADAVAAAGGIADEADLARVNLARVLVDGEQVHVPRPGEPLAAAPGPARPATAAGAAPAQALDLNAATVADLEELPGIGPVLAERIVDWRDEHGRFTSADELGEVSGIGEALLEQLRPLVRV